MTTERVPILDRGQSETGILTGPPEERDVAQTLEAARPDRQQIERKLEDDARAVAEAREQRARQQAAARRAKGALQDARRALRRAARDR